MNQNEKAKSFAQLHEPGNPCVLYNIWDAAGAQAVTKAGAKAVATGSWSVAAAHGFEDGETIPLDLVERIAERICAAVELPVTIDFEGGYANAPADVAANVQRIIAAGAVGINFEDQVVGGNGMHDTATQCERIAAIRESADQAGMPLFINARTDLFLQATKDQSHSDLVDEAKAKAIAYRDAGASGIFVPGLVDEALIADFCRHNMLPTNIMVMDGTPSLQRLAKLGVSRVSYGPGPFFSLMGLLEAHASAIYESQSANT